MLSVNQPTREANDNRDLVTRADPASDGLLLPSLDSGITLLDIDDGRGVPLLQSLVLDHLLFHNGPAFWIDANGHATTTTLAQITPSQRLLERIHVARGFTAYQHYGVVFDLPTAVSQHIQHTTRDTDPTHRHPSDHDNKSSPHTPSLIVAPALDAHYRDDDTLRERHTQTLQARTLANLTNYADGYDIPILVTRTDNDEFTAPIETAADHCLHCEQTRMGPRFVGDEFETLVYPVDDGAYYQTTFTYWRQVLGARAEHVGIDPVTPSTPGKPTSAVGTGVSITGEATPQTANPLLDAWTGTGGQ